MNLAKLPKGSVHGCSERRPYPHQRNKETFNLVTNSKIKFARWTTPMSTPGPNPMCFDLYDLCKNAHRDGRNLHLKKSVGDVLILNLTSVLRKFGRSTVMIMSGPRSGEKMSLRCAISLCKKGKNVSIAFTIITWRKNDVTTSNPFRDLLHATQHAYSRARQEITQELSVKQLIGLWNLLKHIQKQQ